MFALFISGQNEKTWVRVEQMNMVAHSMIKFLSTLNATANQIATSQVSRVSSSASDHPTCFWAALLYEAELDCGINSVLERMYLCKDSYLNWSSLDGRAEVINITNFYRSLSITQRPGAGRSRIVFALSHYCSSYSIPRLKELLWMIILPSYSYLAKQPISLQVSRVCNFG